MLESLNVNRLYFFTLVVMVNGIRDMQQGRLIQIKKRKLGMGRS